MLSPFMRGPTVFLLASLLLTACPERHDPKQSPGASRPGAPSGQRVLPRSTDPLRFRKESAPPSQFALSPRGNVLALWSADGTMLQLIDGRTLQPTVSIRKPKSGRPFKIRKLLFAPDGQHFVVLAQDRLRWWQRDGQNSRRLKIPARCLDKSLSFAPDGSLFALVGCGNVPWIWRTADGSAVVNKAAEDAAQKSIATQGPETKGVHRTLHWSMDSQHALVSGQRAFLWDLSKAQKLRDLPSAKAGLRWANLSWHPNGKRFVFAPGNGSVSLYSLGQGLARSLLKPLKQRGIENGDPRVAIAFRPDGQELSVVDAVGGLHRFPLKGGKQQSYEALPPRLFGRTGYDSSGRFLAYPLATGGVALFDMAGSVSSHKVCDKVIAYDSDYGDMRWARSGAQLLCYSESRASLVAAEEKKHRGTIIELGPGRALPVAHVPRAGNTLLLAGRAIFRVNTQSGTRRRIAGDSTADTKAQPSQLMVHPSGLWALRLGKSMEFLDLKRSRRFLIRFGKKARLVVDERGRFFGPTSLAKQELQREGAALSLSELRTLQLPEDPLQGLLRDAQTRD